MERETKALSEAVAAAVVLLGCFGMLEEESIPAVEFAVELVEWAP